MGWGILLKDEDSGAVEPILYREASGVEESWPVGKHFLKLKKISFIALADLGTTAQPTSAAAVIEKLVCLLYQPKTCISSLKELSR